MSFEAAEILIVALRNEKGSYSLGQLQGIKGVIVALRNEKGSYSALFSQASA